MKLETPGFFFDVANLFDTFLVFAGLVDFVITLVAVGEGGGEWWKVTSARLNRWRTGAQKSIVVLRLTLCGFKIWCQLQRSLEKRANMWQERTVRENYMGYHEVRDLTK